MHRGLTGRYEITSVVGETIRAFIPLSLPSKPLLEFTAERQRLLEFAMMALGRLDSVSLWMFYLVQLPNTCFGLLRYFADGDVLFAKITPCMQNGKHAIASNLTDGIGFGTTEFHLLPPSGQVLAEWIHYFIRQKSSARS